MSVIKHESKISEVGCRMEDVTQRALRTEEKVCQEKETHCICYIGLDWQSHLNLPFKARDRKDCFGP